MKLIPLILLLPFFAFIALSSCKHRQIDSFTSKSDSISESNLISTVGINTSEFKYNTDKYHCLKILSDSGLGIQLKLYQQENTSTFRKLIVFVENNKGFKYAFPYIDEIIYSEAGAGIYYHDKLIPFDSNAQNLILKHISLEKEFNYMTEHLGLNTLKHESRLQKFITLFEDSLLNVVSSHREVNLIDTVYIRRTLKNAFPLLEVKLDQKRISLDADRTYNQLISDIEKTNIRYFKPLEGWGAFWRFEISSSNKQSVLFTKITLVNKEHFSAMFF